MSVEPAWSVICSVAREGQKRPAGAHGVRAPQDFGIHSWDKKLFQILYWSIMDS